MSVQGHLLEITVVGCGNLRDTEWISRQDPYVVLEYASNRYRTKTDTDGGRNPKFNEKYMLPLIEGLKDINVTVWNSNTLSADDFIGSGTIRLQKVLAEGYHDSTWPLTTRKGRRAGEIRVILHYKNPKAAAYSSPYEQHAPPLSNYSHYPPQAHATPSPYPPQQLHGGYPPVYPSHPSIGHSPYPPYGAGVYGPPMSSGSQSAYNYPPSYPPQAYPQYPPQGHGSPYPTPYPPPY